MVTRLTWEEETQFKIKEAKHMQEQAQLMIKKAQEDEKFWGEYLDSLEKALGLARELSKARVDLLLPDEHFRKQSTWENLKDIMEGNNGVLVVSDAVTILVNAKVFDAREHARNVIYSTLYSHNKDVKKVRSGVYQLTGDKETRDKSVHRPLLNNPMSFSKGLKQVLEEANGQPLPSSVIWQKMQQLGVKSNSSNPIGWVNRIAQNIGAEKVSPQTWRLKIGVNPNTSNLGFDNKSFSLGF